MASYSAKIKNKYGTETFQDTKNTYDWIIKSLNTGKYEDLRVEADFLFHIGGITCSCKSIDEFIENAFEQPNFELISCYIWAYSGDNRIACISLLCEEAVSISTESKKALLEVQELLDKTNLDIEETSPKAIVHIENQNNSVVVNGDKNIIATNHSNMSSGKTESKIVQWISAIAQNLLANWIGYLLTLIIGTIVGCIFTKH